ncbi:MAG: hypothetical protein U1F36_22250 [Planctomycetota bacterium]
MLVRPFGAVCPLLLAAALTAQSNTIPGRDLRLSDTWAIQTYQRTGTYPTGNNAVGTWTTVCNPGTNPVPFMAPMTPDHAFIHWIVARESDGRLVQISNWGWVKHTFGSNNDPSSCGSCAGSGRFSYVEVGCADTYANSQAVDHFNLGPPEEVNPWTGVWVPTCSYFDRGDPPVAVNQQCDGARSFTHAQANVLNQTIHNQVQVHDVDLAVAGANFYWQAGYLVPAEAEANRNDNIGSRQFFPSWNGSAWSLSDGPNMLQGSILQRWSGATISSNNNGNDDGRFYVAVKVTGPVDGWYHYEYAVHNRDNARGLGALRIPVCTQASVRNFGFHDIDQDPNNAWNASKIGGEIVFTTNDNPERWNSVFNFWFDCDAAPEPGVSLALDQFDPGQGAATVNVLSSAPTGLYSYVIGPGCGNPSAPALHAGGSPSRASLGNANFALRSVGNAASSSCGFLMSLVPGQLALQPGCVLYTANASTFVGPFVTTADASGLAAMPLLVPNDPALEGVDLDFQSFSVHAGGAVFGTFDLSNGLRVRIGSLITTCP